MKYFFTFTFLFSMSSFASFEDTVDISPEVKKLLCPEGQPFKVFNMDSEDIKRTFSTRASRDTLSKKIRESCTNAKTFTTQSFLDWAQKLNAECQTVCKEFDKRKKCSSCEKIYRLNPYFVGYSRGVLEGRKACKPKRPKSRAHYSPASDSSIK